MAWASCRRDRFEPALLRLIGAMAGRKTPVIACGMVGSRQGWFEAPYRAAALHAVAHATLWYPVPTTGSAP